MKTEFKGIGAHCIVVVELTFNTVTKIMYSSTVVGGHIPKTHNDNDNLV